MQSLLVLKLATHVATTGLAAVKQGPVEEAQTDDGFEQTCKYSTKIFLIYTHSFDGKIKIRFMNNNQLDALFIFSLLSHLYMFRAYQQPIGW
jgi:hypothetical protein